MLKTDKIIICIVLALLAFGIIMVYSSSFIQAERSSSFQDGYFFFKKQVIWVLISLVAMVLMRQIPYQFWGRINYVLIGGMFLLLIAVFLPVIGRAYYGAHRWVKFGPIGFQPSEFAKLALIIFVAAFISKNPEHIRDFKKGFLPISVITGCALLLILIEPDIGTAVFLGMICLVLLVVGGIRLSHILPVGLILGIVITCLILYKFPHVENRLHTFLNPTADPAGKGYQINQALIGLGAGGISGVGLGSSLQKLFFLPQQHTDFILVIIGEEMGFVGTLMIVLLFLGLAWSGRKIALSAPDSFGLLLALGITLLITLQALINMAVVTASIPTKGIALPFISFGGSSMLTMMSGVGILLNIAKQSEPQTELKNETV